MYAKVSWSRGIEDAWVRMTTFVPRFLGFLLILLIGWFVVKAIAKIADALLERVGFDRAIERSGLRRALSESKYDPSDIVSKLVFWALFLIVLQLAFGSFGPNPVNDLLEGVIAYLPKVLAAVIIVVIAFALASVARDLVKAAIGGLSYGPAVATGVGIAIASVGVFAALDQLRIAPAIVTGLFYAVLAMVVGVVVVAVGGGGIRPMQERWSRTLAKWDAERPQLTQQLGSKRPPAITSVPPAGTSSPSAGGNSRQSPPPPPPPA